MAEYIDRNKIPWAKVDNPKGIFWERIVFESAINNITPADVIERSEYEYLKKENRELAIKYDNAMNMVINEQENVTRLRTKVDKAIKEMERYSTSFEYANGHDLADAVDYCIGIIQRNIGE